jgi:hypothetical protein
VIQGDTQQTFVGSRQTTRALIREPIRWISVWTPDCRWLVDLQGTQVHLSQDPLLYSISSQTTILTKRCALPVPKQVLSPQDPVCPMEDLLLCQEDILAINLLPNRAPLSRLPCSLSRPHLVNPGVVNRHPSLTSNSVLLFRW